MLVINMKIQLHFNAKLKKEDIFPKIFKIICGFYIGNEKKMEEI